MCGFDKENVFSIQVISPDYPVDSLIKHCFVLFLAEEEVGGKSSLGYQWGEFTNSQWARV